MFFIRFAGFLLVLFGLWVLADRFGLFPQIKYAWDAAAEQVSAFFENHAVKDAWVLFWAILSIIGGFVLMILGTKLTHK